MCSSHFPRRTDAGLDLAPALNIVFNRLPWLRRASPSATLHETVVSTDADKLIAKAEMSIIFSSTLSKSRISSLRF
jgi:hypothetical protein